MDTFCADLSTFRPNSPESRFLRFIIEPITTCDRIGGTNYEETTDKHAATDTTVNTVNALKVSGGAELIATNNNRDGKALSFGSIAVNSGYDYMEKDTTSSYKTLPTEGRDEAIKNYRRIKIAPTTIVTADDVYIAGEKAWCRDFPW